MSKFLIIIIAISIFIAYAIFKYSRFNKKIKNEVEEFKRNREYLSPEKLYDDFKDHNSVSKELFTNILNCIYEEFDLEIAGYIRLDDDFETKLSFIWKFYDEWKDIELLEKIENKFQIKITDTEAKSIITVKDLILLVKRKLDQ